VVINIAATQEKGGVMAQGEFTKKETIFVKKCVEEIFEALPTGKKKNFIGHLNDIFLFLSEAEKAAPIDSGALQA